MYKAFKFRLYPTTAQDQAMVEMLETHRRLYNAALAERKDAWESEKRGVRYAEQSAQLKEARKTNDYLARTNFSSCQATLRRLDKAFQAFFRRIKAGDVPGYPRFKGRGRFGTVEFPSYGDGCKLCDSKVYLQHIGMVKIKMHRPVEGTIKTVSLKREADGWHVVFCCDLGEVAVTPSANPPVGIDLGLKAFLVTSDGGQVSPPQFFRKAQEQLRRAQRKLARRKKGSRRRAKARQQVVKIHQHIANQRRDFHHKVARSLVGRYGKIAHEALAVDNLGRSRLAKSVHDAGWGQFLAILGHKAAEAGVLVVAVNPRNTTQACSSCGSLPDIRLTLADRVYHCASCGLSLDRDENAARNIMTLGLGRSLQALTWGVAPCVA